LCEKSGTIALALLRPIHAMFKPADEIVLANLNFEFVYSEANVQLSVVFDNGTA